MRITVELSTEEAIALRRFANLHHPLPVEEAAALALREYRGSGAGAGTGGRRRSGRQRMTIESTRHHISHSTHSHATRIMTATNQVSPTVKGLPIPAPCHLDAGNLDLPPPMVNGLIGRLAFIRLVVSRLPSELHRQFLQRPDIFVIFCGMGREPPQLIVIEGKPLE
jgi:hypothetical protein